MSNRIDTKLSEVKAAGRPALAPFVTIGYPDVSTSEAMVEAILDAGADMLELGIPFSDPIADGPTVQMSSFEALKHGVTLHTALDVLRSLRKKGVDAPLIFMGYLNPFLHYGIEKFARDAGDAGMDGIIIPDLPPEEAAPYEETLSKHGIYLIPLLAPTSTDKRIADACKHAKGFIYCVSVTGVTGARRQLSLGVEELVGRIRKHTDLPVLVGFGVSRREHVESIGKFASGAIVASAMLNAVADAPDDKKLDVAREFISDLVVK